MPFVAILMGILIAFLFAQDKNDISANILSGLVVWSCRIRFIFRIESKHICIPSREKKRAKKKQKPKKRTCQKQRTEEKQQALNSFNGKGDDFGTIYLDAGHGGKDGGASANGIKEKDITLKIVLKMKKMLEAYECRVELSREKDEYMTLDARTDKANLLRADCLISVHCNSATTPSAKGFESYRFPTANTATTAFQKLIA